MAVWAPRPPATVQCLRKGRGRALGLVGAGHRASCRSAEAGSRSPGRSVWPRMLGRLRSFRQDRVGCLVEVVAGSRACRAPCIGRQAPVLGGKGGLEVRTQGGQATMSGRRRSIRQDRIRCPVEVMAGSRACWAPCSGRQAPVLGGKGGLGVQT